MYFISMKNILCAVLLAAAIFKIEAIPINNLGNPANFCIGKSDGNYADENAKGLYKICEKNELHTLFCPEGKSIGNTLEESKKNCIAFPETPSLLASENTKSFDISKMSELLGKTLNTAPKLNNAKNITPMTGEIANEIEGTQVNIGQQLNAALLFSSDEYKNIGNLIQNIDFYE